MLFNKTRQYSNNIQFFNKMIFSRYRTRQIKATETNKLIKATGKNHLFVSIVLICLVLYLKKKFFCILYCLAN